MPSSRFLNPTNPGGLLSPGATQLTAQEISTVQALAAGTLIAVSEVLTGTVDGSNKVFTTASTVNPTSEIWVYIQGLLQLGGGVDYTFSGTNTVTFVTAPQVGMLPVATYYKTP